MTLGHVIKRSMGHTENTNPEGDLAGIAFVFLPSFGCYTFIPGVLDNLYQTRSAGLSCRDCDMKAVAEGQLRSSPVSKNLDVPHDFVRPSRRHSYRPSQFLWIICWRSQCLDIPALEAWKSSHSCQVRYALPSSSGPRSSCYMALYIAQEGTYLHLNTNNTPTLPLLTQLQVILRSVCGNLHQFNSWDRVEPQTVF